MNTSTKARNTAVQHSLNAGDLITVGNRQYRGRPPAYADRNTDPLSPADWIKTQKGIPYVKVRKDTSYA